MRFQPFSEPERLGLLAGPHTSLAGGVVGGVMGEIQLGVLKPESSIVIMLSELVQLLLGAGTGGGASGSDDDCWRLCQPRAAEKGECERGTVRVGPAYECGTGA